MVDVTVKDVLASISKLRGASVDEIAADLGVPAGTISSKLDVLARNGSVRTLGIGTALIPNGAGRFASEDLSSNTFELTPRGFLELRS
jgi:predicted ArsR family transcriptional regulator